MGSGSVRITPKRILLYIKRNRRQVLSFLVCLALSALLWFSIKLNRQYVHAVTYEVNFNGTTAQEDIMALQSPVIKLEIKTHGYEILFYRFSKNPVVTLDLDQTILRETSQPGVFYLTAQSLVARISSQLPLSSSVLSVKPDTLLFRIARVQSRKVPVIPALSSDFKPSVDLHDTLRLSPDSIVITGAETYISQVSFINSAPVTLPKGEGAFRITATLVNPHPDHLKLETDRVEISGIVSKFIEKSFQAQVVTSDTVITAGVLKGQTAEVRCHIPAEELAAFNPLLVEVVAAKLVKEGNVLFAILEARGPAYVKKIRLIPEKILVEPVSD